MSIMSIVAGLVLLAVLALVIALGIGAFRTRRVANQAEEMVPQAGQIAEVPGGALHYVDMGGDGPTLVMIHGLSGQMQHFTYAMTDLLKDDFRIVLVDRPGCGYSRRNSAAEAELPAQARMIWALLDRLGIDRPVLVGHSLGGAVSLAMALERPESAGALALLAPLTHPNQEPSPAFAGLDIPAGPIRTILAHSWAVPIAQGKAKETLDEVFRPDPWPEDFVILAGGALGLRPRAFLTAVEDFAAGSRIDRLSRTYEAVLKTPGGVLFGDGDALLDPDLHGQTMERYGLTSVTLPGRGHMIPITAPRECADFVKDMAKHLG